MIAEAPDYELEAIAGPLDGDVIDGKGRPQKLLEVAPDIRVRDAGGRVVVHRYGLGRVSRGTHAGQYVYLHLGCKELEPSETFGDPHE